MRIIFNKTDHNRISLSGVIPLAESFDVVGIFTRDVRLLSDVFTILRVNSGQARSIKKIRLLRDSFKIIRPEVVNVINQFAHELAARLGAVVEDSYETALTKDFVGDLLARLQAREIWANHAEWVRGNREFLAPDVQTRLERAEKLSKSSNEEKSADAKQLAEYRRQYKRIVKAGEIMIIPIMQNLPPMRNASAEELLNFRQISFRLSAIASLTGAPEIVVPVQHKANGLTYGVGIMSATGEDETLLSVSREV